MFALYRVRPPTLCSVHHLIPGALSLLRLTLWGWRMFGGGCFDKGYQGFWSFRGFRGFGSCWLFKIFRIVYGRVRDFITVISLELTCFTLLTFLFLRDILTG